MFGDEIGTQTVGGLSRRGALCEGYRVFHMNLFETITLVKAGGCPETI